VEGPQLSHWANSLRLTQEGGRVIACAVRVLMCALRACVRLAVDADASEGWCRCVTDAPTPVEMSGRRASLMRCVVRGRASQGIDKASLSIH
jgi:hypothetical protein